MRVVWIDFLGTEADRIEVIDFGPRLDYETIYLQFDGPVQLVGGHTLLATLWYWVPEYEETPGYWELWDDFYTDDLGDEVTIGETDVEDDTLGCAWPFGSPPASGTQVRVIWYPAAMQDRDGGHYPPRPGVIDGSWTVEYTML